MLRIGNKRCMWPLAEMVAECFPGIAGLERVGGKDYAKLQIKDTHCRQALLRLYREYGVYGVFAAATHRGHIAGENPVQVARRLALMLPARYQRSFAVKAVAALADGNASSGVARTMRGYIDVYVASPRLKLRRARREALRFLNSPRRRR